MVHKTLYTTAISVVTHKLIQTFKVNINSLACFKAEKEAQNFHQIPSNIARQKTKLSYINSDNHTDTVRLTNCIKWTYDFAYYNNGKIQQ